MAWVGTHRPGADTAEVPHAAVRDQQLLHLRVLEVRPSDDPSADAWAAGALGIADGGDALAVLNLVQRAEGFVEDAGLLPVGVLPAGGGLHEDRVRDVMPCHSRQNVERGASRGEWGNSALTVAHVLEALGQAVDDLAARPDVDVVVLLAAQVPEVVVAAARTTRGEKTRAQGRGR